MRVGLFCVCVHVLELQQQAIGVLEHVLNVY